jgi:hypothetical protein
VLAGATRAAQALAAWLDLFTHHCLQAQQQVDHGGQAHPPSGERQAL